MEKDGSGHHFFQFCIGLLLGSRQSLGRVLVPFCQIQHHILVPIDLILVDIIVQPTNTQNITVNIRVTVQRNQSACDYAVTVDNVDDLVAYAVHIFRTRLQQAVLVLLAAVKVRQLLARVIAVRLCIMVAVSQSPVHAQRFHQLCKNLGAGLVIESACLERHRVRNVAGDYHEVRLFYPNHCSYGIDSHSVLFNRHPAAADMYIRQLHHFQSLVTLNVHIAVVLYAVFQLGATGRTVVVGLVDVRLNTDDGDHGSDPHKQRQNY